MTEKSRKPASRLETKRGRGNPAGPALPSGRRRTKEETQALNEELEKRVVERTAALRESEAKFRALAETTSSAILVVQGTKLRYVNSTAETITGYTRDELQAVNFWELAHPDFQQQIKERAAARLRGEKPPPRYEIKIVTKRGDERWVDLHVGTIEFDGKLGLLATATDITERKRMEQALRESHNLLRAVSEGISDALFVKDVAGRYLMINAAGARILRKTVREVIGKTDTELFSLDSGQRISEIDRRVMLGGEEITLEEMLTVDEVTRTFLTMKAPYRDGKGKIVGLVGISRDITERKRLEEVLRDFVANASHEFKTPLTAVLGSVETLLGGSLEDSQTSRDFLHIIRDHAMRLGRLTDDLLKLSQIEAGKLELNLQSLSLGEVLDGCLETIQLESERKGLTLLVQCPSKLPPVRGDAGRLREVVQNLLNNAVQFTMPGGRIKIQASAADGQMRIAVSDTGVGISRAEQGRVFERFYRGDAARSREVGGTGLGLAIAWQLVEAHGGRIEVESEVGLGSTFSVFLPTG